MTAFEKYLQSLWQMAKATTNKVLKRELLRALEAENTKRPALRKQRGEVVVILALVMLFGGSAILTGLIAKDTIARATAQK